LGLIPGVKPPGREVYHSLPPDTEVKNEWSYTSAALYASMVCTGISLET